MSLLISITIFYLLLGILMILGGVVGVVIFFKKYSSAYIHYQKMKYQRRGLISLGVAILGIYIVTISTFNLNIVP